MKLCIHIIAFVSICFAIACVGEGGGAESSTRPKKDAIDPPGSHVQKRAPEPALDPKKWQTEAEKTGFRATADYSQTIGFLKRLEPHLPEIKVTSFGQSAEGRALPLVILGKAHTPEAARALGKPIVLIQNAIHPGEVDGKDACLLLLRDLLFGKRRFILDAAVLLMIPIYNVDGHERVSPYHRPNQNGPLDGMGFRSTTQGLDLNRDHVKTKSPEAKALVALFNEWRPHLHIDNHVTNGCDHDWVLTYILAEQPQLAAPIHDWIWKHVSVAIEAMEERGHRVGPYVWLNEPNDPSQGFTSSIGPPRFSTAYFAMRNRPSILVETHSLKPFRKRVLATRDFIVEILRQVEKSGEALMAATASAERTSRELGSPDAPGSEMAVSFRIPKEPDSISFPIYRYRLEPSVVYGTPLIQYKTGIVDEMEVPWFHGAVPDVVLDRPRGYFVANGWPVVEDSLRTHGIKMFRLKKAIETEVETIRIANPRYAERSYQGEIRTEVDVKRQLETRRIPAGTLWIPADQPDFATAAQLIEPEAPDSLVQWGLLKGVFEHKSYMGAQVLEAKAKELLRDPEIESAWKKALKNKEFASDRRARFNWWYSQTKYWDDHIGLLPCMRVLEVPDMMTEAL